jgi:dipeptidyl aminopeptidase/acylaminoacyl peptidase
MRAAVARHQPYNYGAFPAGSITMVFTPVDRRVFLKGTAAAGLALPFAGVGRTQAREAELVARKVFFDNADCYNVRVSPNGKNLAWAAPIDKVINLFVAPVADPGAARPVTHVTGRSISTWFRWTHTNRHLVFFRDRDGDENYRAFSVDIESEAAIPLTPEGGVKSFLQEISHKFPQQMLVRHNQRDKRYFDVFRINVVTGESRLEFENPDFYNLLTDSDLQLRLAARLNAQGTVEWFERQADGSWQPFTQVPIGDVDSTHFVDFSADGKTLYLIDSRGRDKAALFAMDMATRKTTLLAADDEADIVEAAFDEESRSPIAAKAIRDRVRWYPVDVSAKADLANLTRHGSGDVVFVSDSLDRRLASIYYQRDSESSEFALLDRSSRQVRKLFVDRKSLAGLPLRKLQPVVMPARDGLRLNGYLTMPEGSGKVPLVLLIHGGPYLRDTWGFSPTHQWLANRGYAVLSVNYRGSTGYGKAFVTKADKEWGGRMHDDLIDAVDWAVGQGIADPGRIGFFGGSYGGYSALTAATKTPEVFACIVDLFGISNLNTFMKTIPPYWGPWMSVWKNRLGDPDTEEGRAFLTERSPLTHIDRVVRPILIAQGMNDVRVVPAESEQMVTALKARGVPVTYITFSDEGHGFVRPENRLAFNAVAEAFLAKYLGGRVQPIGDDFKGSTLKVETGGELVPGLKV